MGMTGGIEGARVDFIEFVVRKVRYLTGQLFCLHLVGGGTQAVVAVVWQKRVISAHNQCAF